MKYSEAHLAAQRGDSFAGGTSADPSKEKKRMKGNEMEYISLFSVGAIQSSWLPSNLLCVTAE